jgi:hypothetical protein
MSAAAPSRNVTSSAPADRASSANTGPVERAYGHTLRRVVSQRTTATRREKRRRVTPRGAASDKPGRLREDPARPITRTQEERPGNT